MVTKKKIPKPGKENTYSGNYRPISHKLLMYKIEENGK